MTVYLVVQVKIKDREEYQRYSERFMGVFEKFEGTLLTADFSPKVVDGEWDRDRIVVMSFPSEEAMKAWITSAEYQEISVHRAAGAETIALLAQGIEATN